METVGQQDDLQARMFSAKACHQSLNDVALAIIFFSPSTLIIGSGASGMTIRDRAFVMLSGAAVRAFDFIGRKKPGAVNRHQIITSEPSKTLQHLDSLQNLK